MFKSIFNDPKLDDPEQVVDDPELDDPEQVVDDSDKKTIPCTGTVVKNGLEYNFINLHNKNVIINPLNSNLDQLINNP